MTFSQRIRSHRFVAPEHPPLLPTGTRGGRCAYKAEVQAQELSYPLSMEVEDCRQLVQRHPLDDSQAQYLALPRRLEVSAAPRERRQTMTVQLADKLEQLHPVAELWPLDQLRERLPCELFNVVDIGSLKARASGRA